jgi:hypothetical protein
VVAEKNRGSFGNDFEPLHTPRPPALMTYEGCDRQLFGDGLRRGCQDRVALARTGRDNGSPHLRLRLASCQLSALSVEYTYAMAPGA